MNHEHLMTSRCPHAVVGAGKLVATVWKSNCDGWVGYQFNTYAVDAASGTATQLFHPEDLSNLVRLCHALACTFVNEDCIGSAVRCRLSDLIEVLDKMDDTRDEDA